MTVDRRARHGREEPADRPQASDDDADPYAVARRIVLRQLTLGPRSRAQLEVKLAQRGCPDEVAAAVLDRFDEVGLVDDEAFARDLVRSRHAAKGLARRALAHELRNKGVADEHVEEALGEVTDDREEETATRLVERRLSQLAGLSRDVQTRRLAGMLARKGYGPSVAFRVVRNALDAAPEHQRD